MRALEESAASAASAASVDSMSDSISNSDSRKK
jgi:hypothetical protein